MELYKVKDVLVMMSTYNGEKYIKEQIDSIINQKHVRVVLLIRDDGSSDNTIKYILEYCNKHDNIQLIQGKNIGWKRSFMKLVYYAGNTYDYYAFADQDDIWLDNKLSSAINKIEKYNLPMLYYSMMTQVDKNLNIMDEQQEKHYPIKKHKILFQNFVQGSTIVYNNLLQKTLLKYKIPKEVAHDIWLPIVATYLGKVCFDVNSYILYRKHEDAVTVNMSNNYFKMLIHDLISKKKVDNYAIYMLEGYENDLQITDKNYLSIVKEYKKNKFKLFFDSNVKKTSLKGTILLKLSLLFNFLES